MTEQQYIEFEKRMTAMKAVIKLNDPEKYEDLLKESGFWSPEISPMKYSEWVNQNYVPNAEDPVSLNVYSLLMNMPIEKLRQKIITEFGTPAKNR